MIKLQIPSTKQEPMTNVGMAKRQVDADSDLATVAVWVIGIWNLFENWCLVLDHFGSESWCLVPGHSGEGPA
jgi:hypothetical protein